MKLFKTIIIPACVSVALSLTLAAVSYAADAKPAAAAAPAPAHGFLQQLNEGFSGIYEQVVPSVVIIDTTKKEEALDEDGDGGEMDGLDFFFNGPRGGNVPHFRLPPQARKSEGSGFIVRQDGYIFTNNHVVEGAEKIDVKLKDGRHFSGKVVGADEKSDIAVVKIEAMGLPVVQFADSDAVKVGQMVCSIGIPFNLDYSFACGWVSGKGRTNLTPTTYYEDYIQTDSFVNPGDSGGPVLDIDGKVIGMNTLINGIGRKMTFAIPSNMLKDIGDQLIATGKVAHCWLGIGIYTLGEDSSLKEMIKGIDHGVVVSKIDKDAPAFDTLRVADVITDVDGKPVVTAHELQKEILKKKVGQSVDLTIWRDGKSMKVAVVTGKMPDMTRVSNVAPAPKKAPDAEGDAKYSVEEGYGLKVKDMDKETAGKLNLKDGAAGVVVTDIGEGGPASVAGVKQDDVIIGVDSQEVGDVASFKALLDKHEPGKPVLLFIDRKGQKTYAILKIN